MGTTTIGMRARWRRVRGTSADTRVLRYACARTRIQAARARQHTWRGGTARARIKRKVARTVGHKGKKRSEGDPQHRAPSAYVTAARARLGACARVRAGKRAHDSKDKAHDGARTPTRAHPAQWGG
eukprot:6192966-Pleurochrysis_carterae.AAC.1